MASSSDQMSDKMLALSFSSSSDASFPLHEAILQINRKEVTRLLFEERVDPNRRGFSFNSQAFEPFKGMPSLADLAPIHLTVIISDWDTFQLLLDIKTVDINIKTGKPFELNSLELATISSQNKYIELLIIREALPPTVDPLSNGEGRDSALRFALQTWGLRNRESIPGPVIFVEGIQRDQVMSRVRGTFIHHLCEKGLLTETVLKNLLNYGLDINDQKSQFKRTPLHVVCVRSWDYLSNQLILILLKHGANLSLRDEGNNIPLMTALYRPYCSLEVLKNLTPSREVMMALNSDGHNALTFCMKYIRASDAIPFMDFLFRRVADIYLAILLFSGKGLFFSASLSEEHLTKMRYLLKKGLKPSFDDIKAIIELRLLNPLLFYLSFQEELDLTYYLPRIFNLVLVNFKKEELFAPIKHLIEDLGVDPNAGRGKNDSLISILFVNFYRFSPETKHLLDYLLKHGWKPQEKDVEEAFRWGSCELLTLLLHHLQEHNLKERAKNALVLLKINELTTKGSFEADRVGVNVTMKRLLDEYSFDPNYCDESRSFLLELIRNNKEKTVIHCLDFLLTLSDFDVNICFNGETPLLVALRNGYYDLGKKLIRNFADLSKVRLPVNDVSKGFSGLFKLLSYSGYRFGSDVDVRSQYISQYQYRNKERGRDTEEIKRFKRWLDEKQREVVPLQRMAGNVVRRVYGNQVKDILHGGDFPDEVKNILLLKVDVQ